MYACGMTDREDEKSCLKNVYTALAVNFAGFFYRLGMMILSHCPSPSRPVYYSHAGY
jgi:hypothetical protein